MTADNIVRYKVSPLTEIRHSLVRIKAFLVQRKSLQKYILDFFNIPLYFVPTGPSFCSMKDQNDRYWNIKRTIILFHTQTSLINLDAKYKKLSQAAWNRRKCMSNRTVIFPVSI